ncbi:hypothetical protein [Emticicia sp. TH156]|uniref:hypothetical protein n=1 Tax=Emticicia sp. TH156 TaxID=2067454 RepID=UPI000C779FC5|nr:hypothetical protein [Emticicia sp. TH156]PLK42759.1 hypothetical protein C0V77_19700 [Emticicia sp. TH156]
MVNKRRWFISIVVLVVMASGIWHYFSLPKNVKEVEGLAEYDSLAQQPPFKKIVLRPFKHVVVNCDLGPVKVYLEADRKSYIEMHRNFMKYVEITYTGDTLIIHTLKTPKSTKEKPIQRQIYLHSPDLQSYWGEATQTIFSDFATNRLTVNSRSSYIRFVSCEIENLTLTTNKACNYVLDPSCSFNHVFARINKSSALTCLARVQTELRLTAVNLTYITLSQQNASKLRIVKD